jgi:hypothetical protein
MPSGGMQFKPIASGSNASTPSTASSKRSPPSRLPSSRTTNETTSGISVWLVACAAARASRTVPMVSIQMRSGPAAFSHVSIWACSSRSTVSSGTRSG